MVDELESAPERGSGTVRLDPADYAEARTIADALGWPLSRLLGVALRAWLKNETVARAVSALNDLRAGLPPEYAEDAADRRSSRARKAWDAMTDAERIARLNKTRKARGHALLNERGEQIPGTGRITVARGSGRRSFPIAADASASPSPATPSGAPDGGAS